MLTEVQTVVPMSDADSAATQTETATSTPGPTALKDGGAAGGKPQILEEVVIEEVSIDGMCGVY